MIFPNKFQLKGKTAFVSGGAGLIGAAIVQALAEAGAKTIIADVDQKKSQNLVNKLKRRKLKVIFEKLDITENSILETTIEKLYKKYKGIDICINCAYPRTSDWTDKCEAVKPSSWEKNVSMQLNSNCLVSKKMAHLMKKSKIAGSIINLSSIYGVVAPDMAIYEGQDYVSPPAYSAIKGGIVAFSRYLASYYGKDQIRVNVISPGGVFDNQNKTFVKNYTKRTPLKRMAYPEDIASGALFLASDAASYITGINLVIDGGWTAI